MDAIQYDKEKTINKSKSRKVKSKNKNVYITLPKDITTS